MSAITAKASRIMKKYAVLTREPRCFLGSFDFSWEQRKLGDIGKARSGVGFPDADQGGVTGVPFFKVSDMNLDGNENEMIVANNYVTAEQIADHRWSPITELPAIFFAKVGAAVMLNRKRLCRFPFLLDNNTMAYSLSPTKWDADFAKALFGTVDLTSLVQVGALPSYNAGDVESMGIYLPSLFEQEQIGAFFKLLDNLITLHQRKCANLCSPSQVVFSLLFATSTFSWEQRKAKEICSIGTGKSNTQDQVDDGKYPFYIRSDVPVRSNKYLYDCEAVITIGDGNIGKVFHYVNGKFDLHQRCYKMTDFKDIWGKYFFYYFSTKFYDRAMKMTAKATVDSVRLEMISEMDIKKPPQISEQKQIAEFFANLDNLITLHQRECISFTGRADRLILTANKKRTTSSWEQRKFEEIAVRSSVICSDDTLPRVEYEDIVSGTGRLNKDIYAKQSIKSGIAFHQGDVLYGKLRPYLQNWLLPTFDGLAVGDFWVLQPQNADSSFLYRLIQSRQFDEVANQSTGTKMPRADWKLVSKTVFSIPSNISEQAAIGTYFTALDSLITLHQRKPFLMKWRTSDANRNQTNRLVL